MIFSLKGPNHVEAPEAGVKWNCTLDSTVNAECASLTLTLAISLYM